jgi:hypothetical protein
MVGDVGVTPGSEEGVEGFVVGDVGITPGSED